MLLKKTFAAAAGLVGVAHSTPVELAERQLVCPDNGTQVVIQNRVISYPVVINQFFGENTIININGGVTININNAPVTLSTTVVATTTVAATVTVGAATVATPFIIQIGGAAVARKRQLTGLFLSAGGQAVTECGDATVFTLGNGQLFSGGQIVSTNNGLASSPLAASAAIGDITGTFSAAGRFLEWTNPLFNAGSASFCLVNSVLNAAFSAAAQSTCVGQDLTIIDASSCTDLSSSSSSSTTGSSTTSSDSTATSDTSSVTGTSDTASVTGTSDTSSVTGTSDTASITGTSSSATGPATTDSTTTSAGPSSNTDSSVTTGINIPTSILPTTSLPTTILPTTTGGGGGIVSVVVSGVTGIVGVATSCLNAGDVNCLVSGVLSQATGIVGGATSVAVPVVTSLVGGVTSDLASGVGGIVSAATSCLDAGDPLCIITAVVGGATSVVGGVASGVGSALSTLGVALPTISIPIIGGGL